MVKFANPFKASKIKIPAERLSVGIDIGTSSIKLIKLKLNKDSAELLEFAAELSKLNYSEVLKRLNPRQELKNANFALSGPATIIRYINLPRMSQDELRQALRFEAQKHIPFNVGEVNLDACILKKDLPDNKMLVLLAALKKESLKQHLKLIGDAGLAATLIDIDSLALINAFNFSYPQDEGSKHKSVALLNIGASFTNLNILEDSIPRLSRDLHLGGNNFTQKLSDLFGIDFASAEALKLKPDQERLAKIAAGIESVLSSLASEARISFDYYESQCVTSVSKIFLSGGGSLFPGLGDMLANLLGIEVEYWDPLKRIQLSSNIDSQKVKAIASQLAVAVGLALRYQESR